MNSRLLLMALMGLTLVTYAFPPDLSAARPGHCRIKAVKDVYLEVYYSRGGRKSPNIRRKNELMWSGMLPRGGMVPVTGSNGWIHLTFQDMTQEDPRSENDDTVCQGGSIILVPR